jgi:hypothetical protein
MSFWMIYLSIGASKKSKIEEQQPEQKQSLHKRITW